MAGYMIYPQVPGIWRAQVSFEYPLGSSGGGMGRDSTPRHAGVRCYRPTAGSVCACARCCVLCCVFIYFNKFNKFQKTMSGLIMPLIWGLFIGTTLDICVRWFPFIVIIRNRRKLIRRNTCMLPVFILPWVIIEAGKKFFVDFSLSNSCHCLPPPIQLVHHLHLPFVVAALEITCLVVCVGINLPEQD